MKSKIIKAIYLIIYTIVIGILPSCVVYEPSGYEGDRGHHERTVDHGEREEHEGHEGYEGHGDHERGEHD